MRADGTTVPDDTHDLCVYKVTVTFMFKHLAHSLWGKAGFLSSQFDNFILLTHLYLQCTISNVLISVFVLFAQYDEKCFYDSMTYLHMPSRLSQMANHASSGSDRLVRNSKDTFYIKTIVCSTKLTQNGNVLFFHFFMCQICCSRKYPYPSHGKFAWYDSTPPPPPTSTGNSILASYLPLKIWLLKPPLGYGNFLEQHTFFRGKIPLTFCSI